MLKKSFFGLLAVLVLTLGAASTGQCVATLAPGGTGDLLFSSLYDVRNLTERAGAPWENYITIQNTANAWVAAHIRFRTQTSSIEVYDHVILLSPYDVLWLSLNRGASGGVEMTSGDTTTLRNSGLIKATETSLHTFFDTNLLTGCGYGATAVAESEVGYIEVIGLWQIDSTNHNISAIAYNSYEDPLDLGAVNIYDILYTVWGSTTSAVAADRNGRMSGDRNAFLMPACKYAATDVTNYIGVNWFWLRDCRNVLQASIEMGDVVTGAYQLENFVAIDNFRTTIYTTTASAIYHRDGYNSGVDGGVIAFPLFALLQGTRAYTAGATGLIGNAGAEVAWYSNPDVSTTVGPTLRDGDSLYDYAHVGSVMPEDAGFNAAWSLREVEDALVKAQIWSYFMNSTASTAPFNAIVTTDVVFTLPTKHNHFNFNNWKVLVGATYVGTSSISYIPAPKLSMRWPFWNGTGRNYALGGVYVNLLNSDRLLVKGKYDAIYGAPVYLGDLSSIFNTTQDKVALSPVNSPNPYGQPTLPNEVNVIRVGSSELLSTAFIHGQLFIQDWLLTPDSRENEVCKDLSGLPATDIYYPLFNSDVPIIGQSIRQHVMTGSSAVHRTASAPLHYSR